MHGDHVHMYSYSVHAGMVYAAIYTIQLYMWNTSLYYSIHVVTATPLLTPACQHDQPAIHGQPKLQMVLLKVW